MRPWQLVVVVGVVGLAGCIGVAAYDASNDITGDQADRDAGQCVVTAEQVHHDPPPGTEGRDFRGLTWAGCMDFEHGWSCDDDDRWCHQDGIDYANPYLVASPG